MKERRLSYRTSRFSAGNHQKKKTNIRIPKKIYLISGHNEIRYKYIELEGLTLHSDRITSYSILRTRWQERV